MGVGKTHIGKWRSIEFELIFKSKDDIADFKKFVEEKKYSKYVIIKDDGSIEINTADYSRCNKCSGCTYSTRSANQCYNRKTESVTREICVSFYSGNEQIVYDVCNFFQKRKAYVNTSCGTHVHFDMRHVDRNMMRLYAARLACAVSSLKTILPKTRRNNSYCKHDISDNEYNRYAFINTLSYDEHKTLEVRGHSGTINADKILNWIKICETIMLNSDAKTIKNHKELIKYYKFDKKMATYIAKRHEEVNAKRPVAET